MTGIDLVQALAICLLRGAVLHADGVTAGNGVIVDWRTVPSGDDLAPCDSEGETIASPDAFDVAYLLLAIIGEDAARRALARATCEDSEAPPEAPRVVAFMQAPNGGRRRCFEVDGFSVYVEPHENDAAQAEFTARLASLASGLAG